MKSRRIQRTFGFLLFTSLVLAAAASVAQERELSEEELQEYQLRLTEGAENFQAGKFAEARTSLERAYAIYPNPVIQFSIAGTYRRQDDDDKALEHYRRFLEECSGEVCRVENKQQVAIAEETIKELEAKKAPPPKPVDVPEQGPVDVEPSPDPGRTWRWVGIGVGAAGLAALGVAGVEQLRASGVESEIEDELAANGNMWTQALADREDDGKAMELRARILAVTGVVAAGAGVGIYYYGHLLGLESESVAVTPLWGEQTGFALSGTF